MKLFAYLLCLSVALTGGSASAGVHGSAPAQGAINLNLGGAFNAGTGFDYPFINFIKNWAIGFSSSFASPSTLDANGYPLPGTFALGLQGTIPLPASQTTSATQWVIRWSGVAGTSSVHQAISLSGTGAITVVSDPGSCVTGVTTISINLWGTNCRVVFTFSTAPTSPTLTFQPNSVYDGSLANLALYRLSDETDYNNGKFFNPDFLAKIKALRPRAIRVVNYSQVNGPSNLASTAADLTIPATAVSWSIWWNPSEWAGSATGGTTDYNVTSAGPLVDGYTMQLAFSSTSTASPTLSIDGGTTKIPLYKINGTSPQSVSAGYYTVRYDSLLNRFMTQATTTRSGQPLAALVQLANELNADLYYNIPTFATDALVTAATTYIKNNLVNTAYYEWSLEVWNFGPFNGTFWAEQRGIALNFPTAALSVTQQIYDYYALRHRQVMGLVSAVYGGQSSCGPGTKCIRILANSTNVAPSTSNTYRFQGVDLNVNSNATLCTYLGGTFSGTCSGAPTYNTFPDRPVDYTDAASWALYWAGAQTQPTDLAYLSTFGQNAKSVTAANNGSPAVTLTIANHGYSNGNHVTVGGFTGGWTGANIGGTVVSNVTTNTFTIPVDASGFSAYSANGGTVTRFQDELNGLLAAADAFASSGTVANACNGLTTPVGWMDCDVTAGTNYGVLNSNTINSLDTNTNTPFETVLASYDGARPSGLANLIAINYEGGMQAVAPVAATCTTLGIDPKYCGTTGTIANLLGVGTAASPSSYKMSSAFQATVKVQFDQFMAHPHSKYPAWYTSFDGGQWGLGTGSLYDPTFTSYQAIQNYHFP